MIRRRSAEPGTDRVPVGGTGAALTCCVTDRCVVRHHQNVSTGCGGSTKPGLARPKGSAQPAGSPCDGGASATGGPYGNSSAQATDGRAPTRPSATWGSRCSRCSNTGASGRSKAQRQDWARSKSVRDAPHSATTAGSQARAEKAPGVVQEQHRILPAREASQRQVLSSPEQEAAGPAAGPPRGPDAAR